MRVTTSPWAYVSGPICARALIGAKRLGLGNQCTNPLLSYRQKALSSLTPAVKALELPAGHRVQLIPSGCCGMAGAFGYEEEHFALSQQIGELVLFPSVRSTPAEAAVVAPGTSCRHQIKDGTGRIALHPAEVLFDALLPA